MNRNTERLICEMMDHFSEKYNHERPFPLENSDAEYFVELVAKKCADICDLYGMPDGTSETARILSAAIKAKFGIKNDNTENTL